MSEAGLDFYTVGIGASAGGLEALQRFFHQIPANVNVAFVVIQHLSPDYESHMVDLLAKQATLPVLEATDGMSVKPNHIYLIPRRKQMTILQGKLILMDYNRSQGLSLPIDIFFESLAHEGSEKAIGIILSGTGSDGTHGILAIKDAGGLVMAQDHTAKFDGMPRSAIATQLVDQIGSPEQLAESLLHYIKNQGAMVDFTNRQLLDESKLGKLFAVLRAQTGMDFSDYKPNTIFRRLERRMALNQIERFEEYTTYLSNSVPEAQNLAKEFLIAVTRFFRDTEAFQFLAEQVIPEIFANKRSYEQVRVWGAGCATGEEAYSLAILLYEHMERHNQFIDVKIFATDIDSSTLDFASRGLYPEASMEGMSAERLRKFFTKKGDHYEIVRHIRNMVVFARQNIIKDPPFARIDLVVCRNLLIYLKAHLQQQILAVFQFALQYGGHLFLGSSESVGDFADVFVAASTKWKIYRYQGNFSPRLPVQHLLNGTEKRRSMGFPESQEFVDEVRGDALLRTLVEQFMPPSVVVDENWIVLHAFGNVKPFLEAPIGFQVSLNIQKMVAPALATPLSTALHRTFAKEEKVVYRNICVEQANTVQFIHLTTQPFTEHRSAQRRAIVFFEVAELRHEPQQQEEFNLDQATQLRIAQLEKELQFTRENLQATIEELETANEELQAANEELLAANEELQSTNEELQSVNEELITVNTEYQMRIRELTQLNDDINNLFNATPIGTILLDAHLQVRKFTPTVQQVVNLLEQDIGRPLSHISDEMIGIDLSAEARQVLRLRKKMTLQVRTKSGGAYMLEISPYISYSHQIDGVILSFIDASDRLAAEGKFANEQLKIKNALDAAGIAYWEMDLDTGQVTFSPIKAEMLGYHPQKFNHYTDFTALIHMDDYEPTMQAMRQHIAAQTRLYEAEYRIRAEDQSYHWFKDIGQVVHRNEQGQPLTVIGITTDITTIKQMRATLAHAQIEQSASIVQEHPDGSTTHP